MQPISGLSTPRPPLGMAPSAQARPAFGCAPTAPVKFGNDDHDHDHVHNGNCCGQEANAAANNGPSIGQRLKAGTKEMVKNVFRPSSLLKDAVMSGIITVATCWLPGSQLLTIPLYLSIMAAFRAVSGFAVGYKHPDGQVQPPDLS